MARRRRLLRCSGCPAEAPCFGQGHLVGGRGTLGSARQWRVIWQLRPKHERLQGKRQEAGIATWVPAGKRASCICVCFLSLLLRAFQQEALPVSADCQASVRADAVWRPALHGPTGGSCITVGQCMCQVYCWMRCA